MPSSFCVGRPGSFLYILSALVRRASSLEVVGLIVLPRLGAFLYQTTPVGNLLFFFLQFLAAFTRS